MRVRLAQIDVSPGRPQVNLARMRTAIAKARQEDVDLIAFSEMVLPGYLIGDEWERHAFLRDCAAAGEAVREQAQGIVVVFGNIA
ncbi:MAG: NAD(+) synthase, partial [Verrucomicrobia bacterium]|nr:NAD(+) synthase [Verrucomicrobiota bacterium]